ncbi:dipeptide/oligopeptide/nickel ABC transporter permease/ATP-binding protein [Micromonospora sp. NBC_01392]|uniref:ATP-binding cassette domain-containing protein n=1 Tax=Micromonospora sp. NBC_01392 TaxID=2903588 RepID=UPI0032544FC5
MVAVAMVAPPTIGAGADSLSGLARSGPTAHHVLGTDALGRDNLLRTLDAARLTLLMAVAATALAAIVGVSVGAGLALGGRRVRTIGGRFIDLLMAYPPIVVAVLVTSILNPGVTTSVYAIGVAMVPAFARLSLRLGSSVAGRDYVALARLAGVGRGRILVRHILPNVAEPLLVFTSVAMGTAVLALSALSFLGIGVQPPAYDWGQLLNDGLSAMYTNPVHVVGPVVGITLVGLAFGLIGEGLAARSERRPQRRAALPARRRTRSRQLAPATPSGSSKDLVRMRGLVVETDGASPTPIVDGLNLTIGHGEIVGICGESGSGKSSVVNVIADVLPPGLRSQAAELALFGVDVRAQRSTALSMKVGLVFQDPLAALNPTMRIEGQLTEALLRHRRCGRAEARSEALARLTEVGVPDPAAALRRYPHQFSGGLRQRIVIAMALMMNPSMLIADEPTTALDVTTQANVLRLLGRLRRERDMSVLIVSHDLGVLAEICDRVLIMRRGCLAEELTGSDLAARRASSAYTKALFDATPSLSRADWGTTTMVSSTRQASL